MACCFLANKAAGLSCCKSRRWIGQVEGIMGFASALYGAGVMAGVVNLIARHPGPEPVHEILVNRSTLGATDLSAFLASQLSNHWGASLLGTADGQERRDVDGDGWADQKSARQISWHFQEGSVFSDRQLHLCALQ
jgi:outer membrane cobalamin receptor